MLKLIAAIAALVLPAAAMAQSAPPVPDPAPIEVMILGSYHMNNPGRDVHNARIDPVTTPAKQAQLEALSEALARFRPTAVAIEREPRDLATLLDHRYPAFTPADLLTNGDERIQIGYRLAHRLGLERVYAIDEGEREGQPSYFPFEAMSGTVSSTAPVATTIWSARVTPEPSCGCRATSWASSQANFSGVRPWSRDRSEPSMRWPRACTIIASGSMPEPPIPQKK